MKALKTAWKLVAALVAGAAPWSTVVAAFFLLLLGIHNLVEPLAHVARAVLDFVDGTVDGVASWCITVWAGWRHWPDAQRNGMVDRAVEWVDIPEKLAAVHVFGLLVEGAVLLAVLPVAVNAQVWSPPARWAPRQACQQLQRWFLQLPLWGRAERILLLPILGGGVWTCMQEARSASVAWLSLTGGQLAFAQLATVGWVGAWACAALVVRHAVLPLLASPADQAARAGRMRRLALLGTVFLWPVALVEWAW